MFLRVLIVLLAMAVPASAAKTEEQGTALQGAALILAMAAACPTNDDDFVVAEAQEILDEISYTEQSAADMFELLINQTDNVTLSSPSLACGILQNAEE